MLKRIALLLAVCLLVSAGSAALAAEILASGSVDGFSWRLERRPIEREDAPTYLGEGVWIVVTGTGAVPDYLAIACRDDQRAPWWWEDADILYAVKGIEIGRGITAIGNNAFYLPANADLSGEVVVVPDTVTHIGDFAFSEGNHLQRVVVPDSVTSFGMTCFDPSTVIVCSSGSAACAYARKNGNPVALTDKAVETGASPCEISYLLGGGINAAGNPTELTGDERVALKKPTRAGYLFSGWYRGDAKVTKVGRADADGDNRITLTARWRRVTVAKPAKPTLSGAKAGRLTVKLKKVSGAQGYQIQYSTQKTFPKASAKTKNTAGIKLTLKAKSGRTWYVRARAWKLDSAGKKVYGDWSNRAKVKVK